MKSKRDIEDALYDALQAYKERGIEAMTAAVRNLAREIPDGCTKGYLQRWLRHDGANPQDRYIELNYFWAGYRAAITEQTLL